MTTSLRVWLRSKSLRMTWWPLPDNETRGGEVGPRSWRRGDARARALAARDGWLLEVQIRRVVAV